MTDLNHYMLLALQEARESLQEGNHGFGAVIVKDDVVIAKARDHESTHQDPTSHAEMNAIKKAARKLGGDLHGCLMVATHEPCPMCSGAIAMANLGSLAFGASIKASLEQGRRRINMDCREIFQRAGARTDVISGVMSEACALLYQREVRKEVRLLRNITDKQLLLFNESLGKKRIAWYRSRDASVKPSNATKVEMAYELLLERFGISEAEAPVHKKSQTGITFRSRNFCPTLEACRLLELDTRRICRLLNEKATDLLVKQIDPNLKFSRNYDKLRPYSAFCEERITYEPNS